MPASVHQTTALLHRLIQQEFHAARSHNKKAAANVDKHTDRVNLSSSSPSRQAEQTQLDNHLLSLYNQRGSTRP
ncbi:MAG TPA: hypothetical protein VJ961_08525 [Mariprofundaceae bacterium]|nr:hypothetical protein [Mariprofundaceae bacterium]